MKDRGIGSHHTAKFFPRSSHPRLVKILSAFYGTRRFTTASNLSLSLARLIQSMRPTSYIFQIHFNIILSCMPSSSNWFISFRFPHQYAVCISCLPQACHMTHPPHPSQYVHPNNIQCVVQIIKLLITQFYSGLPLFSARVGTGPQMVRDVPYYTYTNIYVPDSPILVFTLVSLTLCHIFLTWQNHE